MNAQAPQLDEPERPRAAIKFTYASGARPLEGYTIKRGVGRGGFGEVYFATSDAGKEVALKLIRRNLDVELRGVTQCLNLKHPNLIALYDIKTDEMGDQWVVMEYVSGESLEEVIDRNPSGLPIEQVLWWMRGLCAGVAYLHDHGIVHRDLKPGNIFSDEGTVKIGDYGLAKFISCSRRSGQTESVGTVHYMAPEIANGRYGREIDTYALGIILFEMLSGHVPFEGESVGEVLMKHLTAEPDLSVLQEPYRDIVKRALAKDPNVRIKNVGELISLLPGGSGEAVPTYSPTVAQANAQPQYVAPPPLPRPDANDPAGDDGFDLKFKAQIKGGGNRNPSANPAAIEEPIWKAIRSGWHFVRQRWQGDDGVRPMLGFQKALLIIAIIWLGFASGRTLDLAIQLLVVYAIYYAIWKAFIRPTLMRNQPAQTGNGGSAATPGAATYRAPRDEHQTAVWAPVAEPAQLAARRTSQAERRRRSRTNWRERANQMLIAKPLRQKLTELTGSMLLAAIFAAIAACAIPLLSNNVPSSELFAMYMWVAVVGTLGSWAILVPSKLVEGKLEEQIPMRFTLMLLGALVGVAAWFIADAFVLKMLGAHEPFQFREGLVSHEMLRWPRITDGSNPPIQVYVAYFAFLFLLPRWWRMTEYTRGARLSLWCVISCVFASWLLQLFWWFPQPQGMIIAGVMTLATQLASPWMPPSKRRAISESTDQVVT
jgi:hypothetical protein